MDGTSRVCQFFPISPLAREHMAYIQSFSYWEAGPAYYTQRKSLDSFMLSYTYEGSGELTYHEKHYDLSEGMAFLIDCRELHQYQATGPSWNHCVLHFSGFPAEHLYHEFAQEGGYIFPMSPSVDFHKKLLRLLAAYTEISPYREIQVSTLLTDLLLSIIKSSDVYQHDRETMPKEVGDIVRYLNDNYAKEVSVDFLSKNFSISKYHLCRSFKKYTGYTVTEYVTQLRIDRAKELLKTTSLAANQIAQLVGLKDENYFYRLFRKHVGVSAHSYRKG